jgi:hypothetical protein
MALKKRIVNTGGLKKPLAKPALGKTKVLARKPGKAGSDFDDEPKKAKIKSGGAFDRANQEKEAQAAKKSEPWRLSVPVGGSVTGYFLDRGEPWSRYEHKIGGGPGKRPTILPCIKDSGEACPVCDKENKEGNYTLFLTLVIPVLKYTRKNERGREETVVQKYAKRLVPIGTRISGKYQRLYERHGTFRGMKVKIMRDGKMDAGSGSDIEFLEMLDEAQIKQLARKGVAAVTEYAEENRKDLKDLDTDYMNAFKYDEVMAQMDADDLAKAAKVSRNRGVGSADLNDDGDFGGDDDGWGDDED